MYYVIASTTSNTRLQISLSTTTARPRTRFKWWKATITTVVPLGDLLR